MAVFLEGYRLQEAGYDGTMVLSCRSSVQFMISGQVICFQGRYFATSLTIQSISTGIYLVQQTELAVFDCIY